MSTAQQLIDLSTEITEVVKSINAIVGAQPLPFNQATANLVHCASLLSVKANAIGQAGLAALAPDVQRAITDLSTQVRKANSAINDTQDVAKVLNIVGAILSGAGGVATSVLTGNLVGAGSAIAKLVNSLKTAIDSSSSA
jgi:hypothetical protein